jgi:hypothetical protein
MNYVDHPHYAHLRERLSESPAGPVAPRAEFPAPEVSSRDNYWPEDLRVPRAVLTAEKLAELHGVAVCRQYSRGWGMHASTGRPTSLGHHVGLRFRRGDGAAAYAVYRKPVTGAGVWTWVNMRTTTRALASITELHAWITHRPASPRTT